MNLKTARVWISFAFIFFVAFYLRHFTFWLPHWQGDQSQYVILAMKIAEQPGFFGYNLSETDVQTLPAPQPPGTEFVFPFRVKGKTGAVLEAYLQKGLGYYEMPFFYKTPILPMTLALSHRWLSGPAQPFVVLKSNLGREVLRFKPMLYLKAQFWAAVVPFAASLMIGVLIFFWAGKELGLRSAFYASFIFATNPVSILTANRLWTEDLMTLWITLAVVAQYYGLRHKRLSACFVSGVLMGLAFLTNQKSLLATSGVAVYSLLVIRSERQTESAWKCLLDRRFFLFIAGTVWMTWKWMWLIHKYYGHPLWQPQTRPDDPLQRDWYLLLLQRPHGLIFYPVGTAAICWAFVFGYSTISKAWAAARRAWSGQPFEQIPLLGWCWMLPFCIYFLPQRTGEYRYLFPFYPILMILSGWTLCRFERWLSRWLVMPFLATGVVWIFLVASAVYSTRVVFESLWLQRNLIHAPW